MLLLFPLLVLILPLYVKNGSVEIFYRYMRLFEKHGLAQSRRSFLGKRLANHLVPKFLKFKVPSNGVFTDTAERNFQRRLLRKELNDADRNLKAINDRLTVVRETLKENIPIYLNHSILFFTFCTSRKSVQQATVRHDQKLRTLYGQPLESNKNSVILLDDINPPAFIRGILSKGPKHPPPGKFNIFHFSADINRLLEELDEGRIDPALVNHINAEAVLYTDNKRQYANKVVRKV